MKVLKTAAETTSSSDDGVSLGFNGGLEEGFEDGLEEGFEDGLEEGFEDSFLDGIKDGSGGGLSLGVSLNCVLGDVGWTSPIAGACLCSMPVMGAPMNVLTLVINVLCSVS
jgi:hypothetical protein